MTEQEFLRTLESSLSGELPRSEVASNVQYYRDYIETKKQTSSEHEVMEQLGDPRLIARTIIDTYQLNHPSKHYQNGTTERQYEQYQEGEVHQERMEKPMSERKLKLIGWGIGIGTILILLLVLGTVFWLGTIVLKIFVRFVVPILLIIFGVTWIRNQIRRR